MSKYEIKNEGKEGRRCRALPLTSMALSCKTSLLCTRPARQDASARQGNTLQKNRHEVSGGGVKLTGQKGTGRARQGSIRAGQWTAVASSLTHPSFTFAGHNKMVVCYEVRPSARLQTSSLSSLTFRVCPASTKQAGLHFRTLGIEGKRTVIVPDDDVNTLLLSSVTFLRPL